MTIDQRRRLGTALAVALVGSIAIIIVCYFLAGRAFKFRAAQSSYQTFVVWAFYISFIGFKISFWVSFALGIRSFYQRRRGLLIPIVIAFFGGILLSVGSCFGVVGHININGPQNGPVYGYVVGLFAGLTAFLIVVIWSVVRGIKSLFEPPRNVPNLP